MMWMDKMGCQYLFTQKDRAYCFCDYRSPTNNKESSEKGIIRLQLKNGEISLDIDELGGCK